MTREPERLMHDDELAPFFESLRDHDEQQKLARVASALAIATGGALPVATAPKLTALGKLLAFGIGAALTAVVVVPLYFYTEPAPPIPPPVVRPVPAPPPPPIVDTQDPVSEPLTAPAPVPTRPLRAARPDHLSEEVALLDRMRETVDRDPQEALRLASEHEQRFGEGRLGTERERLRARARAALAARPWWQQIEHAP